jgi:CRP/FNR family cyclic AMP-dependent transcriptional regulator
MRKESFFDHPGEPGGLFISRVREEQLLVGRVDLLAEAPLFSVLNPADLRTLAGRFRPVRYGRGEVIFREGESAERMFLIDTGRVKLATASPAGQELLIGVLGRGQIFGELEIIDRGPRAMDARTMEDSHIYALDSDMFWTVIENRPALARRLLELMARRLRRADQTSQDLVFFDAPTRLARRLLQLAEEHGQSMGPGEESVKVTVRVTQGELAQMIGVTRESANRLVASFSDRGWVDWNDGYPILLQPEALIRRGR